MTKPEDVLERLDDMSRDELQRAFIDIWVGYQNAPLGSAKGAVSRAMFGIARALGYEFPEADGIRKGQGLRG